MKRFIASLFAFSVGVSVWANDLPVVEFGLGPGLLDYSISCAFGNPSGLTAEYGGHALVDYDIQSMSSKMHKYPGSSTPLGINSVFMLRLPIGDRFAIAYSNRVSWAFDKKMHREDQYTDISLVLTLAGATGLEFEFYPMADQKGLFLGGFLGIAVLNQPFVLGYLSQFGLGLGGTVGWRFNRHIALELNGFYFSAAIPDFTIDKIESLSSTLKLSGSAHGFSAAASVRFGL